MPSISHPIRLFQTPQLAHCLLDCLMKPLGPWADGWPNMRCHCGVDQVETDLQSDSETRVRYGSPVSLLSFPSSITLSGGSDAQMFLFGPHLVSLSPESVPSLQSSLFMACRIRRDSLAGQNRTLLGYMGLEC